MAYGTVCLLMLLLLFGNISAVKSGTAGDTPTDESSSAPGTPLDAVGREDLWRRAGKDSQR